MAGNTARAQSLRPGESDPRIPALRERLRIEGILPADPRRPPDAGDPAVFDEALAAAVKTFQDRHALERGRRDRRRARSPRSTCRRVRGWTRSACRSSACAGSPGDVPDTYVVVNVAGFRVAFVRDRQPRLEQPRGRRARSAPDADFPRRHDLPRAQPDVDRAADDPARRHAAEAEEGSGLPAAGEHHRPRSQRQGRGPVRASTGRPTAAACPTRCARGRAPTTRSGASSSCSRTRIRCTCTTRRREALFEKPERTFSSGCIRVEDPLALAELVMNDPKWNRAALEQGIATGRRAGSTWASPCRC